MATLVSLCIVPGGWIVQNLLQNISDLEHGMKAMTQEGTFLGSYGLLMAEPKAEARFPDSQTSTLCLTEDLLTDIEEDCRL